MDPRLKAEDDPWTLPTKETDMIARFIRWLLCLIGVAVFGCAAFYFVTAPKPFPESHWASLGAPDVRNGEMVFWAGGCTSCHAAPSAAGDAKLVLSGGLALNSPFGTFHVPNISPDETSGIGRWTLADFGNAMKRGVGARGEHLYPAFPYGSYARMSDKDVNDLFAFLKTLPKSANVAPPHQLPFPFNIRLALGGWKFLYFDDQPRVVLANADDKIRRGQYLVEGPGHCGECHTPRDAFGGFVKDKWLAGAPNPEGEGRVPDITPGSNTIGAWSEGDIANYLETGFTPDFDSAGGSMVEVQQNIAHLPASDREAIAAYLKAVPSR
jgi:mono/diheme cytochrome c family protein